MSIACTECANCGNPTPTANLDADGHCGRCSTSRVSASPPKPGKAPVNVASAARKKTFDTSKLAREPIASKIPLATFLARHPVFPSPPALPRDSEGLSST
jgi:hypothetical protein